MGKYENLKEIFCLANIAHLHLPPSLHLLINEIQQSID